MISINEARASLSIDVTEGEKMQVFHGFKKLSTIVCLLISFLPGISHAIMLPQSTEQLKIKSDVVLRGTVEQITCLWSTDHMQIVTHVEISVHDIYKGKLDDTLSTSREISPGILSKDFITVEFDGGKIDDLDFSVSDMPTFNKGEEVIIFLKIAPSRIKNNIYKLVGSAQGKYVIDTDGIAKKENFSVLLEKEEDKALVDNHIPVEELIEKIDDNRGAFIHIDRSQKEGDSDAKIA